MFITIEQTTFNLNRISYVSIDQMDKKVIEVCTCDDRDNYHRFHYKNKEAAAEAFDAINNNIYTQLALYGKR